MRIFWAKNWRRDHLRSWCRSVVLVMVRRWQHSAITEGRSGSRIKCGVTKLVTVHHVYDGPSCKFVMKFREVIPVPIFQELKCFGTKTLDGPLCLWRSVILVVEGNEEEQQKKLHKYGTTESMAVRRDHDDPSWPWRSVVTMTIRRKVRRPSRILADFQQIESLFN